MSNEESPEKPSGKVGRALPYTAKDFQLEVLGQLSEMRELGEAALAREQRESCKDGEQESRLLRFDGRTLVAIGAIALSLTGYVLQDARNTSRRDAEIETIKVRMTNLEKIAETNTEGRIRTEGQLQELREGQGEIKTLIQAHDSGSRKSYQDR